MLLLVLLLLPPPPLVNTGSGRGGGGDPIPGVAACNGAWCFGVFIMDGVMCPHSKPWTTFLSCQPPRARTVTIDCYWQRRVGGGGGTETDTGQAIKGSVKR